MVETIDRLRNAKYGLTTTELMRVLECSRSTVERTLDMLRDADFEIVETRLDTDDYRVKRWTLSKEGLLASPAAEQLLSLSANERFSLQKCYRTADDPALRDAVGKVLAFQEALPRHKAMNLDELLPRDLKASSVGPKQRIDPAIMDTLTTALIGGTALMLSYRGGKVRSVQPHGIVHSRFHYLVCRGEDGGIRTLRLDLITSLRGTDEMFEEPEDWSLERWAQESFGIYHSDDVINVTLEFDAQVADRAERLVFHPTQYQQRLPDGALLVKLRCKGHRELLHEILHPDWLGHVKVLGPPVLVQELGEFLRITQKKHGLS
jgi:predicted DNA-binding transcriptional regulator YafY